MKDAKVSKKQPESMIPQRATLFCIQKTLFSVCTLMGEKRIKNKDKC